MRNKKIVEVVPTAFIDKNFLLKSDTAKKLYFEYADNIEIFDYHCHLNPRDIYENVKFKDITEAWLGADHYKWRVMRSMGIDEKYITGDGESFEKFKAFAITLQHSPGNPLYHWAHLELQRYFDIHEPLTEDSAKDIYEKANAKLRSDGYSVRDFISKSNVKILYTTDDPIDNLEFHRLLKKDRSFKTKVCPAFRPDKALNIELDGFSNYIKELGNVCQKEIKCFNDLKDALSSRIDYFENLGCKASDHGLTKVPFEDFTDKEIDDIFKNTIDGKKISQLAADKYKTAILQFLAGIYKEKNWAMEIHMGILRNNNTAQFKKIGADSGFDSVGDFLIAENLNALLNSFEKNGGTPKIILFSANPVNNHVIGTLLGNFQSSEIPSKIQFGTAWWFNDNIDGMVSQIKALANLGVLGKFVGMLTDSRSFLSYPRHEYFRRILCNIMGNWIDDGEYCDDIKFAGKLIEDICLNNALNYFE